MEVRDRFFNFPIALLRGFPENHMECLCNILDYAVFKMVYSEERIFDDINTFREEYEVDLSAEYIPKLCKNGGQLFNSFYGTKYAWTGIHIGTWEKYYGDRKKADLMVLLANLALKSIIQDKPWANVKNSLLFARMAGFDGTTGDIEIPESIIQFMNPGSRTRPKLFLELRAHFGFKRTLSNSIGITYSYSLSLADLEFIMQKRKYLSDKKKQKEKDEEERKKAKEKFEEWKKKRKPGDDENKIDGKGDK